MNKVTESTRALTAEQVINQVGTTDIPEFQASLSQMMDSHFLNCAGDNPEPAYAAYIAIDKLSERIIKYKVKTG